MPPIEPYELEQLKAAGRRMYQGGLTTGTLGAIGVRLPQGNVAVTAAGTRLGFLDGKDFIALDGNRMPVRENGRAPVMDAGVLAAVLDARPEAGSVVRVHSPYATAIAHSGRQVLEGSKELLEQIGGVAFIPYWRTGAAGLAGTVAQALKTNRVAIIEGQGPVIWGTDIDDAVDYAEALEAVAKVIFILTGNGV
jgi:ribulose-5-phosphate 4-epimerase/fuculose-1-phosphate aldolase